MESVIEFVKVLPKLKMLLVPWMIDLELSKSEESDSYDNETDSSDRDMSGEITNTDFRTLGYPCIDLDTEENEYMLDIMERSFPSLRVVHMFSCYFASWRTTLDFSKHHHRFALKCDDVYYSGLNLHTDL